MIELLSDLGQAPGRADAVRVSVVGLGYWGPNLVRVLNELPEAQVVSVCDVRQGAFSQIAARYPALRGATRYEDVLEDPSIEAVVIATPVSTHYRLAAQALRAGKHVFVEKPLAGTSDEALELIELARQGGRVLMPGHTFLYSPPVNIVRELIRSGELGDVYFVSMSRVNLGLHQRDVSVIWDLGPHDFSILLYWLSELPLRVSAMSRSCVGDTPDVAFITIEFASGAIAHAELSWLAPSKLRRTTIVGSRKMAVYEDTSVEPVRIFDAGADLREPESFGEFRLTYRTGDIVSPRVDGTEPLLLEMRDFCGSVRGRAVPHSSGELGLEVVRVIEAVEASLASGGTPVELFALDGVRDARRFLEDSRARLRTRDDPDLVHLAP